MVFDSIYIMLLSMLHTSAEHINSYIYIYIYDSCAWTPNNFFINPIIYGFRKNVVSYERANDYIKKKHKRKIRKKLKKIDTNINKKINKALHTKTD